MRVLSFANHGFFHFWDSKVALIIPLLECVFILLKRCRDQSDTHPAIVVLPPKAPCGYRSS